MTTNHGVASSNLAGCTIISRRGCRHRSLFCLSSFYKIVEAHVAVVDGLNLTPMFNLRIDAEVELRLLEPHHAREFFELAYGNREHIGEWMFWIGEDYSPMDAEQHIRLALERHAANNGLEAGIWFRGELVGCVRYNYIDWAHRNTELGYWLGASFQGHGLATRACRAMIDHAFNELQLHRVEIRCMSENARSRRIPERLGFIQEGVLRQVRWRRDHFDDHAVYGMLASDWQSGK
jgi:ribosomal-protein-serine acetyltransferase